jgi:hypothetical protein
MGNDKNCNNSNHEKIIDDNNNDNNRKPSLSTITSTTSQIQQHHQQQPYNQSDQLRIAMDIVDTIRRYEKLSIEQGKSNIVDNTNNNIQGLRNWMNTPGVQIGCMTAGCGIFTMIPIRRNILYVMNQHFKLDTSFTDLIVTPIMTVLIAQCSVYVGTLYGSLHYLNKLSSESITTSNSYNGSSSIKLSSLSSSTITDICNDPILINASKALSLNTGTDDFQHSYSPLSSSSSSSSSFLEQYDLRNNVTIALYNAIRSCDERRLSIIKEET